MVCNFTKRKVLVGKFKMLEIVPDLPFPKSGYANMLLVLESSPNPNCTKKQAYEPKKWKTIQSRTWALNPGFTS